MQGTRELGDVDQCHRAPALVDPRCLESVPLALESGALFLDLKEVLNLHRFYTGSPTAWPCRSMLLL